MVKYVAFEENFRDRCTRVPYFSYGIILGGSLKEEECLFLPIEAPVRNDNESDLSKPFIMPTKIIEIDEKWVARHCKSVLRMVPGGVRISGLFVTASVEEVSNSEDHVLKILLSMTQADKQAFKGIISNKFSEKIILFADPDNKNLHCKAIDLDDVKDSLRAVKIKIQPVINKFKAVKTCIPLSFKFLLPTDRTKETILKRLEEASDPFLRDLVHQTDIMICGEKHEDTDLVFEATSENLHKFHKTRRAIQLKQALIDTSDSDDYWSTLSFVFYGPECPFLFRAGSTSSLESGASSDTGFTGSSSSLHVSQRNPIRSSSSSRHKDYSGQRSASGISPIKNSHSHQRSGFRSADEEFSSEFHLPDDHNNQRLNITSVIPGIAFLPTQFTTVADVKQAFREDLVRSTLSRLELLSEQLQISSGVFENPNMCLPQRVLVRLPACRSLPLSDYKFCSETQDEIVARLICLSLPLGSHSISDSQTSIPYAVANPSNIFHRLSSSSLDSDNLQVESSPDSGNDSINEEPEIAIDASCVDFCLETIPNGGPRQNISDRELLQELDQSIKKVARYSRKAMIFAGLSIIVVLFSILIAYSLMK